MPQTAVSLITIAAITAVGSAANSVAGGGTLLTFPALIALGVPPIAANATSAVALWPGSISSMLGYRRELAGAKSWATRFAVPSLLGGIVGAVLLLVTSEERFAALIPFLVLGATTLFALQKVLVKRLLSTSSVRAPHAEGAPLAPPTRALLVGQFGVAVYGGYFGAGAGILMLAALGFMGLTNIHQMNGLKAWGAVCFNGIAAGIFVFMGLVDWPIAAAMMTGAVTGGYLTAGLARRAPQSVVRGVVTAIGLGSTVWLFLRAG